MKFGLYSFGHLKSVKSPENGRIHREYQKIRNCDCGRAKKLCRKCHKNAHLESAGFPERRIPNEYTFRKRERVLEHSSTVQIEAIEMHWTAL